MFYVFFGREREFNCISCTLFFGSSPLMTRRCLCVSQNNHKKKKKLLLFENIFSLSVISYRTLFKSSWKIWLWNILRKEAGKVKVSFSIFKEIIYHSFFLLFCSVKHTNHPSQSEELSSSFSMIFFEFLFYFFLVCKCSEDKCSSSDKHYFSNMSTQDCWLTN